jgi:hypothetical protein
MNEIATQLARAVDQTNGVITATHAGSLHDKTPCKEYRA